MKDFLLPKTAALVLGAALSAPALLAQTTAQTTAPTPHVMSDVEPLPASERESLGAIILEDSPVLAQREAFQRLAARNEAILLASDPMRDMLRQMGAGPAPAASKPKLRGVPQPHAK